MNIWDACYEGYVDRVTEVSKQPSFDVNKRNPKGLTPLICSIQGGHIDVVQFLLSLRPDVSLKDPEGYSANEIAVHMDRRDISSLLDVYIIAVYYHCLFCIFSYYNV